MARKPLTTAHLEEDTRPYGGLRFADPCTAEFPRSVHPCASMGGENESGGLMGVRTQRRWDYRGGEALREMHRKRGVGGDE